MKAKRCTQDINGASNFGYDINNRALRETGGGAQRGDSWRTSGVPSGAWLRGIPREATDSRREYVASSLRWARDGRQEIHRQLE